jgi:iron complex transport system substrate-binding protein
MGHGGNTDMKRTGKMLVLVASIMIVVVMTACGKEAEEQTTAADNQRVVESVKGDISVPANPKRVVGTTVTYPDFLYALGVTPVAAENYHEEFPSYFKGAYKDVLKLGINSTVNFERVLAAAPDLILAPAWRDDKSYDQLSQIAPTVLLPDRDNWRDELKDIGKALNIPEKADQAIQSYDRTITEAKAKLDALIGDETVTYMRITPKGSMIFGSLSNRGKVIHEELGLKAIDAFPKDKGSVEVSLEMLPEYNPDHLILQIDSGADVEQAKRLYENMANTSIWKSMKAVKNDHVYLVGDNEWFNFGYSPVANVYAIDQIVKVFEKSK